MALIYCWLTIIHNLILPNLCWIESASGEDLSGIDPASGEDSSLIEHALGEYESEEVESGMESGSEAGMLWLFFTYLI